MSKADRSWIARIRGEYAVKNVSRAMRDVLEVIPSFRGRDGIFPSHESIAKRAQVCTKTVQRALAQAEALQLLVAVERPRWRLGWRSFRASKRLILLTPSFKIRPGRRLNQSADDTTGQAARGVRQGRKEAASMMIIKPQPGPVALDRQAQISRDRQLAALADLQPVLPLDEVARQRSELLYKRWREQRTPATQAQ